MYLVTVKQHVLIASWDPIRVKIGGLERSIFKQEYVLGQNLEWLCYQIPEIELFASVGSKAKYSRNLDAMDMWTLGCLLYEMLFSKPPCCCGVLQSCKCMGLSTERSISIPWSFDDCGLRNIDFPIDLLRDSSVEEIKQNHGDFRIHEVVVNVQYGFKNNNRGGIGEHVDIWIQEKTMLLGLQTPH
jgi:serine/threonine protein kinase